jgi:hypothetical protein
MKQAKIWKVSHSTLEVLTVARDEGEAMNNAIEMEPLFAAIGCVAEPFPQVEGFDVVALVPDKYVFGDARRSKVDKAEREAVEKAEREAVDKIIDNILD